MKIPVRRGNKIVIAEAHMTSNGSEVKWGIFGSGKVISEDEYFEEVMKPQGYLSKGFYYQHNLADDFLIRFSNNRKSVMFDIENQAKRLLLTEKVLGIINLSKEHLEMILNIKAYNEHKQRTTR